LEELSENRLMLGDRHKEQSFFNGKYQLQLKGRTERLHSVYFLGNMWCNSFLLYFFPFTQQLHVNESMRSPLFFCLCSDRNETR
jgi:hypothetical protein